MAVSVAQESAYTFHGFRSCFSLEDNVVKSQMGSQTFSLCWFDAS